MRISSSQIYQQGIDNMTEVTRQLAKTQAQVSSGKRFQTPADDPVAASRVVQVNQEIALRDQYQNNLQQATNALGLEDSTLGQVTDVLQRIRELAVQAGDGVLTQQDRASLATEISTRTDELMSLMNSRSASGEYLFSGSRGQTQPFQRNSAGQVVFMGDESQRRVQITASSSLAINDSGRGIFQDVPSVSTTVSAAASPNNTVGGQGAISIDKIVDQKAVDALFPDGLVVQFGAPNPDGSATFTVTRASDGRVVDNLQNVAFHSGDTVTAQGIQFNLTGNPVQGDKFTLTTGHTQSMVSTVEQLAAGLTSLGSSDADQASLKTLIDQTLGNLDNSMDSISRARAEVGARMNTADSTTSLHQDVETQAKDMLSKLSDIDYAATISQLNMQQFVLQAAQQSYAKISGLSLFNFL
ncbi:MAG TPA: flagellar hook-associated protein FlgL [Pseudomonadales bacterium]|nr:flagellar hook-associated protein FlgL [Pseudomonadales bacterium]